jgi:hypothetical protein
MRPLQQHDRQKGYKMTEQMTVEEWLAVRRAEGRKIDPATAEVDWRYAQVLDPYGVYPDLPEECDCIGREYLARRPGSKIWVEFGDLPDKTCKELWQRLETGMTKFEDISFF